MVFNAFSFIVKVLFFVSLSLSSSLVWSHSASLSITDTGTDFMTLSWAELEGDVSYELARHTGDGNWQSIAKVPAGTTTYTDNNITAQTTYYYRLRATFPAITAESLPLLPTEPSNLSVINGVSQATLNWNDNASNEESYILESVDGSNRWVLAADTTSYVIQNLQPETSYTYQLYAQNAGGKSNAIPVTVKTLPFSVSTLNLKILAPQEGEQLLSSEPITFIAEFEGSQNVASNNSVKWSSSIDGFLGQATELTIPNVSGGVHTITAELSDNNGNKKFAQSNIVAVSQASDLNPPESLSAPETSQSGEFELNWPAVEGAEYYRIERSFSETDALLSGWKTIWWVNYSTNFPQSTDASRDPIDKEGLYRYMVRACAQRICSAGSPIASVNFNRQQHSNIATPELTSAIAKSYAQVDLEWEDINNGLTATLIEMSQDGQQWNTVGQTVGAETTYSVYGLDPLKTYYFRLKALGNKNQSATSNALTVTTPLNAGTDYYVSKSGSDSADCLQFTPCLTIRHTLTKADQPGDRVLIGQGTYTEPEYFDTHVNRIGYGMYVRYSGTRENPITVMPAPENLQPVIIDQQGRTGGILVGDKDYIHIKDLEIKNVYRAGISTGGFERFVYHETPLIPGEGNYYYDEGCGNCVANVAIAPVFTGNYIHEVYAHVPGVNMAGIRAYALVDGVIRNNRFVNVSCLVEGCQLPANNNPYRYHNGAGVKVYGMQNLNIENNYFENSGTGVHYKSYNVDNTGRAISHPVIRFNEFKNHGISVAVQNGRPVEEGKPHIGAHVTDTTITHNLLYGFDGLGVSLQTVDTNTQSKRATIANNTFHDKKPDSNNTYSLSIAGYKDVMLHGNILWRASGKGTVQLKSSTSNGLIGTLIASNENIFTNNPVMHTDWESAATRKSYNFYNWESNEALESLPDDSWNTVEASFRTTLDLAEQPDQNSHFEDNPDSLFIDASAEDYRLSEDSSAKSISSDETHSGAYQYSNEMIIGTYSQ